MKKLVIESDKLKHNIQTIKAMTTAKIIAVLKGNAYGLGILEAAQLMEAEGIDFLAVSEIEEATALRTGGITSSILVLTSTTDSTEITSLLDNGIIPTAGSFSALQAIEACARALETEAPVHLKLDTGFGRYGFLPSDLDRLGEVLSSCSNIRIEGTYSHLSSSFAKKADITLRQYDIYRQCIETLRSKGIEPGMLHLANSCAFLQYRELHLDAVRIGSGFLGRVPLRNLWGLERIGFLKTSISDIKTLPTGHSIGYANTYKTKKPTRIGIIPVGYMDGFGVEKSRDTFRFIDVLRYVYNDLRSFRKKHYVSINGKNAPVLGRINMYNFIVDLGNMEASVGDEVILNINPLHINPSITREYI